MWGELCTFDFCDGNKTACSNYSMLYICWNLIDIVWCLYIKQYLLSFNGTLNLRSLIICMCKASSMSTAFVLSCTSYVLDDYGSDYFTYSNSFVFHPSYNIVSYGHIIPMHRVGVSLLFIALHSVEYNDNPNLCSTQASLHIGLICPNYKMDLLGNICCR